MLLQKIISSVFIFIGILSFFFGIYQITKASKFKKKAKHTFGIVLNLKSKKGEKGVLIYAPVVAFTDEKGNKITFTSESFNRRPRYQVGEKVEVIYNESDPSHAMTNDFQSAWGSPFFILGSGLLLLVVGFYFFFHKIF
jgi:hypothetical protein